MNMPQLMRLRSMVEEQGLTCLRVIPAEVPTGCNQFVFRKRQISILK